MTKKTRYQLSRRQFLSASAAVLAGALIPPSVRALAATVGQEIHPALSHQAAAPAAPTIIADHTAVDQYQNIPQQYIDLVKQMWVQALGYSHSGAYRYGVNLVAALDPKFAGVGQGWGEPLGPTSDYLRVSRHWWYDDPLDGDGFEWSRGIGEEHFWTTQWAIDNVKTNITYCNGSGGIPVAAVGFGWCWDMCLGTGGTVDPVYGCRWGGQSRYWNGTSYASGGYWGLDDDDNVLVNPGGTIPNIVNTQTYIDAVIEIDTHDPNTLCFFTTGPIDNMDDTRNEGESGYQRYLKHEYLRNYVQTNGGVLFDYADILAYDDAGVLQTTNWDGHDFPLIHPDNDGEYDHDYYNSGSCHIGEAGCLRIGKALWWMLARVAGWSPTAPSTPTGLAVTSVSCFQVDLSWDDPGNPDIADYRIYRDGAPVGTSATTSFSDIGLIPNTQYAYTVTARDGSGGESESSNVVNATTPDAPYKVFVPLVTK